MFKIADGREHLFQWDVDRRLIVEDPTIAEVHFCNKTSDCSLVVETYTEDDVVYADIPNVILQDHWKIRVYAYCDTGYTKVEEVFEVKARTKPDDYVYTETEVKSYEALEERIAALEEGGGGSGGPIDLEGYAKKEDVKLTRQGALEIIASLARNASVSSYASNATQFLEYLTTRGVVTAMTGMAVQPYNSGFHTYYKLDSTGTVTTTNLMPATNIMVAFNNIYMAVGTAIYDFGNFTQFKALLVKGLGISNINPNNYYTKSQVDNLIDSVASENNLDWVFVGDTDLNLIDNDSCLYKISGSWNDDIFVSYEIALPGYMSETEGMVINYPVPITLRTATMDADTQLYFRIENGQAVLYRNGEPDPEFFVIGYYYWGVMN